LRAERREIHTGWKKPGRLPEDEGLEFLEEVVTS
jgi:hypothetical protein